MNDSRSATSHVWAVIAVTPIVCVWLSVTTGQEFGAKKDEHPACEDFSQDQPEPRIITRQFVTALVAKLNGRIVIPDTAAAVAVLGNYDPWTPKPLDDLVRNSDLVITGKVKETHIIRIPMDAKDAVRTRQEDLTTITVHECLRGEYRKGDEIIVRSRRGAYSACGGGDPHFKGNENVLLYLRHDPSGEKHVFRSAIYFGGWAFQAKKFVVDEAPDVPQRQLVIYATPATMEQTKKLIKAYENTEQAVRWKRTFGGRQLYFYGFENGKCYVSATDFESPGGTTYTMFAVSKDGKVVRQSPISILGPVHAKSETRFVHDGKKIRALGLFGEKERWNVTAKYSFPQPFFALAEDLLMIADDIVGVQAFDHASGRRLWMVRPILATGPQTDIGPPAIDSDTLFLKRKRRGRTPEGFGAATANLIAIDRSNGRIRWESKSTNSVWRPIQPAVDGDTVFTEAVGVVQALDKRSGKLKWKTDVGKAIVLSLAADNGVVVAATAKELVGLSGQTGKVIWRQPIQLYGCFSHTPPFIRDAVVYVFSKDFYLIALDADTGNVRWKLKASARQQPVVQGNSIYLINENWSLYCLDIAKAAELGHSHKLR